MTTTSSTPSNKQAGKVEDRLRASARKSGLTEEQFQAALGFPGTGLEDEVAAIFVKYAKKAQGIVVPGPAQSTGLVPNGYKVNKDTPEGDVNLGKLDYSACPIPEGEEWVSGKTMLNRAAEMGAIGSLGLAFELLKAQEEGKEIFPVESRGKHYFIMPLTELRGDGGHGRVAYFRWDGRHWGLVFLWLDGGFDRRGRFVRRGE